MTENDGARTESYLVRLWRDSRQSGWRASLQQVRTGQTHHFARPEALWAFLQAEMAGDNGRGAVGGKNDRVRPRLQGAKKEED
jgi:Neuraminidase (sialidase)